MVDTVGLAGLVLELAGTARRARGRVVRVRDAAGIARRAAAVRDGSPVRVDARPGGARGMVDAVGLAGFVLELAVAARRAAGCIGGARGAPSRASYTPPIRCRAVGVGLIRAGVAWLLRVAEWLALVELVLSAWADHAFSSIHSARELASLTAFT